MNYQIGTPLAAQLDPENVKIQHSLMGSRTDFVDRNNFIILEYREKDPLDVTLWLKADATDEHPECVIEDTPEAAVGLEKCKWTVNALINHHYKIISASWQAKNNAARTLVMPVVKADALTEGNNNSWNLVLPAWVNADAEEQRTALNTWKVRMMLEDEKGNKQNSGVVEITVQQDRKIELIVDNIADTDRSDHSYDAGENVTDQYDYRWKFVGTSAIAGTGTGGIVNENWNDKDLVIPLTNAEAKEAFEGADGGVTVGSDGVQGFALSIDYKRK